MPSYYTPVLFQIVQVQKRDLTNLLLTEMIYSRSIALHVYTIRYLLSTHFLLAILTCYARKFLPGALASVSLGFVLQCRRATLVRVRVCVYEQYNFPSVQGASTEFQKLKKNSCCCELILTCCRVSLLEVTVAPGCSSSVSQ